MHIFVAQPSIRHEMSATDISKAAIVRLNQMLESGYIQNYDGETWLVDWEDTGHGSGLTTKIRLATDDDKAVSRVLNILKEQTPSWRLMY